MLMLMLVENLYNFFSPSTIYQLTIYTTQDFGLMTIMEMEGWEVILWNIIRFGAMGLGCLWVVGRLNSWYYEVLKLGNKRFCLPPGDLGWPYIGNMMSFDKAFTSSNPDNFYHSYVSRYFIMKVVIFLLI